MIYVIAEPRTDVKDKACAGESPVDCIYEGERMVYIPPGECVDCGACEPVCPVEAAFYEDDVPGQWAQFTTEPPPSSTSSAPPAARPGPARCPTTPTSPPTSPAGNARLPVRQIPQRARPRGPPAHGPLPAPPPPPSPTCPPCPTGPAPH